MDNKSIQNLEFNKVIDLLLSNITTQLGKKKGLQIDIQSNIEIVQYLQNETSEAQKLLMEGTRLSFSGIEDITSKIKLAIKKATIDSLSILRVAKNLRASRLINDKLSSRSDVPIVQEMSSNLYVNKLLEQTIFDTILSEDEISDTASSELFRIRKTINHLQEKIKNKLNQIISSEIYSKYFQDAIITTRQSHYVIPIKSEYRSQFPGIIHDTSASGATLFIEPIAIVELNNNLRVEKHKELDEIEKILQELSQEIGAYGNEIINNQKILSQLDFIFGKGLLSIQMNGLSPKLVNNKKINLKNARHPLLDKKTVVPLNFQIGDSYNTLVITGPNTGGKTVAIKTVGLLILMVQSGLHIPCDFGSSVSVFDNVFADIGDDQSISQNLSTFSSHMTNIINILKNATKNSLIIFDELGSGTDPEEGSALAIAILEYLKDKKITTIATTHYSDLKNYALNTERVENASVEFDVKSLSPTYRLLIGVPGKSNAFYISQKLGLKHEIIESAKKLLHEDSVKMEDILMKIEMDRLAIEKERKKINITSENVQARLKNLERKEKQLNISKEKILNESKKSANLIVQEAKKESEKILSQLREMQTKNSQISGKEIDLLRNQMKHINAEFAINESIISADTNGEAVPYEYVIAGNGVFVPSFQQNATIVSVNYRKKQAVVQMRNMKINVPYSALHMPKIEKEEAKIRKSSSIGVKKAKNIKPEVDLRGMDLESAIDELSKYLDDAYLSNIPLVTIIHGMGTGVLKKGVETTLKNINYVKSYRAGTYGEGGSGVTIVSLV